MGSDDASSVSSLSLRLVATLGLGVGLGVAIGAAWSRPRWYRRERSTDGANEAATTSDNTGEEAAAVAVNSDGATTARGRDGRNPKAAGSNPLRTNERRVLPTKRVTEIGPPIGRVHSCFSRRNGTPRQGGDLVPSARCTLTLGDGMPNELLRGLDEYSHAWVIYVFHANTNLGDGHRNGGAVKAKVRVPRLDGQSVGALATRTPHRPLPIGLSIGRVVSVDVATGTVTLAGADLVDGTPVLDLKPYVPFCDCVPTAHAPGWVGREAVDRDEPLKITGVEAAPGAEAEVAAAYVESAKERRRRRLEAQGEGGETSKDLNGGKSKHKGKHSGHGHSVGGGSSGAPGGDDDVKRRRKEAKDRRRAGLEGPDALYPSGEAFVAMVREVLALDMRTARERLAPPEKKKFAVYHVTLCDVEVDYTVNADQVVTLMGGRAVPPLALDGTAGKPQRSAATEM